MNDAKTTPTQTPTTPTVKLSNVKRKPYRLTRKEKDSIMADLGLTKVRGAVSGRVYYE